MNFQGALDARDGAPVGRPVRPGSHALETSRNWGRQAGGANRFCKEVHIAVLTHRHAKQQVPRKVA